MKEIKTKEDLLKALRSLPIRDKNHRNSVICSLIGHSRICTTFFGYRYCGRCGDQLGDSLGSVDFGIKEAVIMGHGCEQCKKNYQSCDWKDKFNVANPFKTVSVTAKKSNA